jgi:hypothetical protein
MINPQVARALAGAAPRSFWLDRWTGLASGSTRSEVAGLAPAGTGITNIHVRFDEGFPRS